MEKYHIEAQPGIGFRVEWMELGGRGRLRVISDVKQAESNPRLL